MRRLTASAGMAALALAASVNATTLNKCIDAKGKVTYSNLPCSNARVVRELEIDPAPPPDQTRPQPHTPVPRPVATPEPATIRLETRQVSSKPATRPSGRQCDALSDKLGRVFDKMDQARRKGYTQKQMDAWNQEVKDLERNKQQSGCF